MHFFCTGADISQLFQNFLRRVHFIYFLFSFLIILVHFRQTCNFSVFLCFTIFFILHKVRKGIKYPNSRSISKKYIFFYKILDSGLYFWFKGDNIINIFPHCNFCFFLYGYRVNKKERNVFFLQFIYIYIYGYIARSLTQNY